MERTLIISNHPKTWVAAVQVANLYFKENPVILSVPFIASFFNLIFPPVDIVAVRETDFKSTKVGNAIIRTILGVHDAIREPIQVPEDPIEAAVSKLVDEHRNVLILPAGFKHIDLNTPEKWSSGVGRIARGAYLRDPDIHFAMLRIFSPYKSVLLEPVPLSTPGIMPEITRSPTRDSRIITRNLARYYNERFEIKTEE